MTAKQDRRARKKANRLLVKCDACGRRQPFAKGDGSRHANGELDIAACVGCGHHYGTYA